ncbi:GNAT family N-acetyltransferase [Heyndrickxia sp. MSNUG]|uniref:GNAT family N-acetyltransferase n=1 Tax=Heyndrickxia sp. MSNUG TaxID=3136677 RepID=UPI003C2F76BF
MTTNLFRGQFLKLTAKRDGDAEIIAKWDEDPEYLRNVDTDIARPRPHQSFENEGNPSPNSFYFRLRTIEEDRLIGFVVIHSIEWNNRAGMLAIGIGDARDRNKGYGSDALKLILRYAFHELNLHRVGLDVIEYNAGAIRAYQKAGFQIEGRMRQAVHRDGKIHDRIMMGILGSEWEGIKNNH